jgi:hypothetical protein
VADLQAVALELEGTRLVCLGELRSQASLDVMGHHLLLCVHGVGAEVCDIGGISGERVLGRGQLSFGDVGFPLIRISSCS